MKRTWTGAAASLGMILLILDGKTAFNSAVGGVMLCIRTVIPSLFPFFLLTGCLRQEAGFLRPLGKVLGLPKGAESLLIPAFLGGYPMGAQALARSRIPREEAERMLAFCCNAGPAFLFGVLGQMFPEKWMVWSLWAIHVGSALLVSVLFPCGTGGPLTEKAAPDPMRAALYAMGSVCGWVIFFRVVIGFLSRWIFWAFPLNVQILIAGLLELTNGCCMLPFVADVGQRFILGACFLSMGGLCVAMQTASVAAGLSLRFYFLGKALQTLFSLLLAVSVVKGFWPAALGLSLLFLTVKIRKNSGKRLAVGV